MLPWIALAAFGAIGGKVAWDARETGAATAVATASAPAAGSAVATASAAAPAIASAAAPATASASAAAPVVASVAPPVPMPVATSIVPRAAQAPTAAATHPHPRPPHHVGPGNVHVLKHRK